MNDQTSEQDKLIRILLVEDHALTRIGIKTVLKRKANLQVVGEAANGEEAVSQALQLKPDVILMDVGMPVMDGIQAARQIIERDSNSKIIMLTQHDNEQDILASFSAGVSGYCLKDVEESRLYTAIATVNAGDAWLDSAIASKVLNLHKSLDRENGTPSDRSPVSGEEPPVVVSHPEMPKGPAESASGPRPEPRAKLDAAPQLDRPYAEPLSPRELEVLGLIVEGLSNQEISDRLIISLPTTKTHVRNILNKLAVDDRTQAAVHAMRRGLV